MKQVVAPLVVFRARMPSPLEPTQTPAYLVNPVVNQLSVPIKKEHYVKVSPARLTVARIDYHRLNHT
jgi:hypothetical protein